MSTKKLAHRQVDRSHQNHNTTPCIYSKFDDIQNINDGIYQFEKHTNIKFSETQMQYPRLQYKKHNKHYIKTFRYKPLY